jgi:aminoglycoside phosphotransferase (APT) family kinase protein
LAPVTAQAADSSADDVDVALVTDDQRRRWVVRAPRTTAAGARLAQEARLLEVLRTRGAALPFNVPEVAGTATLPEGGTALICTVVAGVPVDPSDLVPGAPLTSSLAKVIAALHDMPSSSFEDAGTPVYGVEEYRQRRVAEVDRAAASGNIPGALMERWEKAFDEAGAWRFSPCPVHGDLAPENVLAEGSRVSGLLDWSEARVADPADDLAWLAAAASPEAFDAVVAEYSAARNDPPDPHLARRARLSGELAVARWLLHGLTTQDRAVVKDAVGMLRELEAAVDGSPW